MESRRVAFASPGLRAEVAVEADAAEALACVEALFPDFRAELEGGLRDGAGAPPGLRLRLSRGEAGWTLREEGGEGWKAPRLPDILTRLELTLAERMVAAHPGRGLHAAGVVAPPGGAVLLAGGGGAGKSSLTAALARAGWPVLGDDVVLLRDGRVHPFPRLLKVEEPARSILGLPRVHGPLARVWTEASFLHPGHLGSRWAVPAAVAHVVVPERVQGSPPVLDERRTADLLPHLLSQLVLVPAVEAEAFEAVADALAEARSWHLRYWETPAAAECLARELSGA